MHAIARRDLFGVQLSKKWLRPIADLSSRAQIKLHEVQTKTYGLQLMTVNQTNSASEQQQPSVEAGATDAKAPNWVLRPAPWLLLVILSVGLFHGLTLEDGHDWGGDWSQYVSHAENIATGAAYNQTPYFTNRYSHVAPAIYPPVYPLLLAPIYGLFGFDLGALKWVYVLCFCLALGLAYASFKQRISPAGALALVVIIGFNPIYWNYRNQLLSDIPFLCACMGALYVMQRAYGLALENRSRGQRKRLWPVALLLGLCMYLGYGLREVGLVLPLTAIAYELLVLRRPSAVAPIALLVFSGLAFLQHTQLTPAQADPEVAAQLAALAPEAGRPYSHLDSIHLDPAFVSGQAQRYRRALWDFYYWGAPSTHGNWEALGRWMNRLVMLLALLGFGRRLFQGPGPFEFFFSGYLLVLFCFSGFHGIRYLLPVLPCFLFYAAQGFQWASSTLRTPLRVGLLLPLGLATIGLYGRSYASNAQQGIELGVSSPEAEELWDYLAQNAKPGDTIVSNRPRVVGLMSQLKSCGFPRLKDPQLFLAYYEIVGVDYTLAMWTPRAVPVKHAELDPRAAAALAGRQELVFENDYFKLYRFEPRAGEAAAPTRSQ